MSRHTPPSPEPPASFAESPPSFRRVTHDDGSSASGAVVVIDVLDVDRFDVALAVERRAGLLVMRATPAPAPRERVSG